MTTDASTHDPMAFRQTLGMFATGVLIVTTRWGERIHGMTANSFTSVSLSPPLVLICIDHRASMRQALQDSGHYGLSVLHKGQQHLSRHFSSRKGGEMEVPFDELGDVPVIGGALAQFSCRIVQSTNAGDHLIFIGEVTHHCRDAGEPLLYFGGGYKHLHQPEVMGACS